VPHAPQLLAVLRAGLAHGDKSARKCACKLLRHMLHGLVEVRRNCNVNVFAFSSAEARGCVTLCDIS
jgi:hypothetical protein